MGNVYIYAADADDFSTIGICGALTPTRCIYHEIANGMASVELEHPIDNLSRYTCLQENRILKCDVPVRTTPEIAGGQFITVVEQYTVKSGASKANRYIYNKADPSAKKQKKLKLVPVGAVVSVIAKYADDGHRWKVKYTYREKKKKKWVNKTLTGYIAHDSTTLAFSETVDVTPSSTGIEAVAPSWRIEEQLFRITRVEKTEKSVHVEAQHISYDLMYNLTAYDYNESRTLQQAADGMLGACFEDHQFTFQTNIQGAKQGFHFRDKDPITALLDPEIGLVSRWNGELIRDNYSFTVLDHAGVNRGTMFTYGKNIKGISMNLDYSRVATAIRPVGETEAGKPIYLPHSYLWDGRDVTMLPDTQGIVYGRLHHLVNGELTCDLPHARIFPLEGEDCKENKKSGPQIADVRTRLLDQAIAALADGAEQPEVSVDVDMQQLGYTEQWKEYRELEKVFLFDTLRVTHPIMGINLETPVCEMEWDCLEDMPETVRTGAIHDLTAAVAGWQISSVSGAKILPGTVGAKQVGPEAVVADAMQTNSFTANTAFVAAMNAHALNAVTAHVNDITAQTISTDALAAAYAHLFEIVASDIEAGTVSADSLSAAMANIVTLTAGHGEFDFAMIQHLVSQALNLEQGVAGRVFINNLAVAYAQIVDATLNRLVIRSQEGNYYELSIDDATGAVTTTPVAVTPAEAEAGVTTSGRNILETDITATNLQTANILATYALVNKIDAARIDVAELFAQRAFIDHLNTTDLSSNTTLTIVTRRLDETDAALDDYIDQQSLWFTFDSDVGLVVQRKDENGQPMSIWSTITDEVGFHIKRADLQEYVMSAERDRVIVQKLQIGNLVAKGTTTGGWVWVRR